MLQTIPGGNAGFTTPERNRFYYGKLMDVTHFSKEQDYFKLKLWRLNRLVFGSGVVAGLSVTADPQGTLTIKPGLAIDGLGREIIVPVAISVNPGKLSDDQGNPLQNPPAPNIATTISLAYREREVDPSPVLVADCDNPHGCACGTIREEYLVLVRQLPTARTPPSPVPVDGDLQNLIGSLSLGIPQDASVPLARLEANELVTAQPLVYGNASLFELILSLADRVGKLERPEKA